MTLRRIQRELVDLQRNPFPFCEIIDYQDPFNLFFCFHDLEGSLFEGGKYYFILHYHEQHPFKSVKIYCLTKVFHCGFCHRRLVHLDILDDYWSPAFTARTV